MADKKSVSSVVLSRLPTYLSYLKTLPASTRYISATGIAKALALGEVSVRKDLSSICDIGRPKIGYSVSELTVIIESFLGYDRMDTAIIAGAGKLGRALLDYGGFGGYGLEILAAFDRAVTGEERSDTGKRILPMESLEPFCRAHPVQIGIIAVPAGQAQSVCSRLLENHIRAIWSFAPCSLTVPPEIAVQYENMALALAHLKIQIK